MTEKMFFLPRGTYGVFLPLRDLQAVSAMGDPPGDPDPLEAVAEAYRHDPPCITDAMKSLCSYLAATDLVEEAGSGRKPHVSESPGGVVTVSLTHELPHLLACAKAVLRQINAHTLPHPAEWAEANPQGDDESALCRIDAIANYKACHLLAAQLQATPGAKRTKLLGRRYLRTTRASWPALRAAAESELEVRARARARARG